MVPDTARIVQASTIGRYRNAGSFNEGRIRSHGRGLRSSSFVLLTHQQHVAFLYTGVQAACGGGTPEQPQSVVRTCA
eukprot:618843-Pyramimonas_sp.AAC.1